MEYLKIRNWDKWQTYRKDRGQPPWIKIHRCVMRDPEWVSLTDAERGQLVSLWLLAADKEGLIPASSELIQKLCFLSTPPNLKKFTELGFIEKQERQHDANMTPDGCQHDAPEKNRIEKKRKETETLSYFDKFWSVYPKKRSKGDAKKAFLKLNPDKILLGKILSAVKKARESPGWQKNNGEFIPYPATWIRAEGWEDEIEEGGPAEKEPMPEWLKKDLFD